MGKPCKADLLGLWYLDRQGGHTFPELKTLLGDCFFKPSTLINFEENGQLFLKTCFGMFMPSSV